MGRRKIVDEAEVIRWFEDGRTYAWMQAEYLRKYDIETVSSMWSNLAYRRGIERRIQRDDDLIPWAVDKKHRWSYPLMMLRAEARRRAGLVNAESIQERLDRWLRKVERDDTARWPRAVGRTDAKGLWAQRLRVCGGRERSRSSR